MPFAAALSEHPVAAHATGEVVGSVLEQLGDGPDLAVLFVSADHVGAMGDIAVALRAMLNPRTLIGTTAVSVLAGSREVEERPAIALWAGRFSSGDVVPVRLEALRTSDGVVVTGLPPGAADGPRTLLLLADPFTFPVDAFLAQLSAGSPLTAIGGLASAARGPGGNRLVVDAEVHRDGAVGVLLDAADAPAMVVSQGCRPIGDPMTVTRAERNVIYELAGRPAVAKLEDLVAALSPDERALLQNGLHVGRVINEQQVDFRRGDFLIRNVVGADREAGALAVGDVVEVGSTVQFQVRDADSADEDLRVLLAGHQADGALVFTCNGRGTHLFGAPHHDAEVVSDLLDSRATAGMFCAGEIGPVGGRSFLHGFTASVLLFRD
jgi:small ligand-binding sensory domain FIST